MRWLTAVFLLSLTSFPAAAQQCTEVIASFDLVQNAYGDIMIPVSFGGTPGVMGLDFSDYDSALYEKTAEKLQLKPIVLGRRYKITSFGEHITQAVDIPSVTIGKVPAHLKAFLLKQPTEGPDGWFGLDLLAGVDTDIDFGKKKVTLFSPNHCPANKVVYWTDTFQSVPLTIRYWGSFDFPVQIDGHTIQMGIAPLLSPGVVRLPDAGEALGLTLSTPGIVRESQPDLYSFRFQSLKAGDIDLDNRRLLVNWSPSPGCVADRCGGREALGYLSLNQFRSLHLYIAYREKKLYLSAINPKDGSSPTSTASPAAH